MKILDLFCGAGGLSLGFGKSGFSVTGVDHNPRSEMIFSLNSIGKFVLLDLAEESIEGDFDIIIGGPPCRPWSSINVKKRGIHHNDYHLLEKFFSHIFSLRPRAFLLENVPPLCGDPGYKSLLSRAEKEGYSVAFQRINYFDYGVASQRIRLFTVGFRDFGYDANSFFRNMDSVREKPVTVGEAIERFENSAMREFPDHIWPNLKTIHKYADHYDSGKFGWYRLRYDEPAPSFGNVTKTYILHPKAGIQDFPVRVISVREVMAIMGFPDDFILPPDMAINMKYQMIADSVSPVVAGKMASVIEKILEKPGYRWDQ